MKAVIEPKVEEIKGDLPNLETRELIEESSSKTENKPPVTSKKKISIGKIVSLCHKMKSLRKKRSCSTGRLTSELPLKFEIKHKKRSISVQHMKEISIENWTPPKLGHVKIDDDYSLPPSITVRKRTR